MSTTLHCVSERHNTHAIINCLQLLKHAATLSIQPLTSQLLKRLMLFVLDYHLKPLFEV